MSLVAHGMDKCCFCCCYSPDACLCRVHRAAVDRLCVVDPLTGRDVTEGAFRSEEVLSALAVAADVLDCEAARLSAGGRKTSGVTSGAGSSQVSTPGRTARLHCLNYGHLCQWEECALRA
jgi:hypothetical protein